MKKAMNRIVEVVQNGEYTNREAVLSGICLFLLGLVAGMFLSPKKSTMIGSNNGNNNNGAFDAGTSDEEEGE